ncbi:MAG: YceI family protein [Gammaproteobacteria bacterium]|nr:YceI family protein [Gammaproteobacteria bacterium]
MRKFLIAFAALACGCAQPPRPGPPAPPIAPAAVPAGPYQGYVIVSSRVEIRVYRDGPMAQLGHNHVIISDSLTGTIRLHDPIHDSGFNLELPLASLVVDDPAARTTAGPGFVKEVPQADRDATRHNMLGTALLDAERQPVLRLAAQGLKGGPVDYIAQVRVGLRGEERIISVPLSIQVEGERLSAQASFRLRHADLGLTPFSVALGALRVRDDFDVNCSLEAKRSPP